MVLDRVKILVVEHIENNTIVIVRYPCFVLLQVDKTPLFMTNQIKLDWIATKK